MLFAVHISSGVLANGWLAGGYLLLAVLLLPAIYKLREDDIPRIGVFTAAFFIASSLRIPFAVGSVHLILNGLVGVMLGRRAMLAITVGLVLQSLLLHHGGMDALGVNACIVGLPALLAGLCFPLLKQLGLSGFLRGFLLGSGAVAAAAALNFLVLLAGGKDDWDVLAKFVLLAHIPVVLVEGLLLGIVVPYVEKVKPEMLTAPSPPVTMGGLQSAGKISSNGTSH